MIHLALIPLDDLSLLLSAFVSACTGVIHASRPLDLDRLPMGEAELASTPAPLINQRGFYRLIRSLGCRLSVSFPAFFGIAFLQYYCRHITHHIYGHTIYCMTPLVRASLKYTDDSGSPLVYLGRYAQAGTTNLTLHISSFP